mmetsp:Transcript_33254/g.89005  ORF Transcript_33254/g.89005 Transcript_33254/m.89005 type:complete len:211 (+) Transcript_33254:1091-1723(+)
MDDLAVASAALLIPIDSSAMLPALLALSTAEPSSDWRTRDSFNAAAADSFASLAVSLAASASPCKALPSAIEAAFSAFKDSLRARCATSEALLASSSERWALSPAILDSSPASLASICASTDLFMAAAASAEAASPTLIDSRALSLARTAVFVAFLAPTSACAEACRALSAWSCAASPTCSDRFACMPAMCASTANVSASSCTCPATCSE